MNVLDYFIKIFIGNLNILYNFFNIHYIFIIFYKLIFELLQKRGKLPKK
jgi:hypothetical protein